MENNELERLNHHEYHFDIWVFKYSQNILQVKGLYKKGVLDLLTRNGFKKIFQGDKLMFVKEHENILSEVSTSKMQDFVKEYIYKETGEVKYSLNGTVYTEQSDNLKNKFLEQSHLIFNPSFLTNLSTVKKLQLKDKLDTIYLPFINGVLRINKTDSKLLPYTKQKDTYIFKEQIIKHDYNEINQSEQSQFEKFIYNVSNQNKERVAVFESAIGYLIHNYNDSSNSKAVVCYDETLTDDSTPMGGTGKGIFAKSFHHLRHVTVIDGKKFNSKDKFAFQEVNLATQIVSIEDIGLDFKFERLHSVITDGVNVEKKYQPSFTISIEEAPKIIITSNIILGYEGTTNKRRQLVLEFSDYYSKNIDNGNEQPFIAEHGERFFSGWDGKEWNRFYQYIVKCASNYLRNGLQYIAPVNIHANRLQQKTSIEFVNWVTTSSINNGEWHLSTELFKNFKTAHLPDDDTFKQRRLSEWLKLYAKSINLKIEFKTENGENMVRLLSKI